MKKAKKIISRVFSAASVLIFIFGLVVFVSVLNASAGKVPSVFGFSVLQVSTGSMEPELMTGSVVVVKETDVNSLKVGDVISFYSTDKDINGQVNTHRIDKIEYSVGTSRSPIFTTKGDANDDVDREKVHSMNVIGKVVYDLGTVSGSVISVFRNPNVIFFVIVLPLIFITFGEAINLATLIAKSKYDKEEDENADAEEKI
ncbi:MAG: signal peptidase I [Clostridia bacterium]|nr:signal peptidase I [Clostridia bacterium]